MGIGAGLRTGLKHVNGNVIITMDSDLTYDVKNIPKLLKEMKEKNADVVIGTPFLNKKDHEDIPPVRYITSRAGNYIDQLLFGLNFTTPTSFFRAWKKDAGKNVKITFERFAGVPESAIRLHKMGFKIGEIPVKYNLRRKSGKIRDIKISIKNTLGHIRMILSLLMT
jgi:glycosyltransferase involved in cell wall biosynthesis